METAPNPVEVMKEEEDLISSLPDHLLLEFISRLLDTKEAIRTGILSKRWQHLWPRVPNLIFEYDDDEDKDSQSRIDFFSSVDKILSQCGHSGLVKFELNTNYDKKFVSQVNNWIQYAISCHAREFLLWLWDLDSTDGFVLQSDSFFINSCFTHLDLLGCAFNPSKTISWGNLKTLSIACGRLDNDMIQNILSGSPLLESLVIDNCSDFTRIDITSKNVKNLHITGYGYTYIEEAKNIIEINAPYILSLAIQEELKLGKIMLLDVSSLLKAYLDYTKTNGCSKKAPKEEEEDMLKGLILSLLNVKELKIGKSCLKALSRLEAKGFTIPSNMIYPDKRFK